MKKLLNNMTDGKYKLFRIIFTITVVLYVTILVGMNITASVADKSLDTVTKPILLLCAVLLLSLIVEILYYAFKISPMKKSIKLAVADKSIAYIHELTEKNYDTNGKIAFSDHFFYDLKTSCFASYKSISWVYPKDGKITFRTINGRSFRSVIDDANLNALLNVNPHILNGYSNNNYINYKAKVSAFRKHSSLNAETVIFDIPNAIKRFWAWLASAVGSKKFFIVGYSCIIIYVILMFAIFNASKLGESIPNSIAFFWLSFIFIGLVCLAVGYKVECLEPKKPSTYKTKQRSTRQNPPKQNTPNFTTSPTASENPKTYASQYWHKLFSIESTYVLDATSTFIALDIRDGSAYIIHEMPSTDDGTPKYKLQVTNYPAVVINAKTAGVTNDFSTLSNSTWKRFLTEEIKKTCKCCKKAFPEAEIDRKHYCPRCAENWWKS